MDQIIGILGFGQMGQAIAKGLLKAGYSKKQILVTARDAEKLKSNAEMIGVTALKNNRELRERVPDIVILAVNPCDVKSACQDIRSTVRTLVSVVAGLDNKRLKEIFPGADCFSIIPNTAVEVNSGILVVESQKTPRASEEMVYEMLTKLGEIIFCSPEIVDVVSSLSGCGPALVAVFARNLTEVAVKYGIKREQAEMIIAKMIEGTGKLLQIKTAEQLKNEVCSPGGTTIRGIVELEKAGFGGAVISAFEKIINK